MATAVGADVESLCSKCGDVWHVVVAKVGDRIAKVECKECHSIHRYKDPKGVKQAAAAPRRRTSSSKAKSSAAPVVEAVPADLSKPVRGYSTRESFEPGERISHVTFGEGVVQRATGPGKIEVLFADGPKLLAQAKPETKLGPGRRAPRLVTETEPNSGPKI